VRLLLDTHAFLWFILDDPKLSEQANALIADGDNVVEISPASYWEIAIKISLGKYALPESYADFMERELANNDFRILPMEPRHTAVLTELPFHHRDPFDRLLVAQAMSEQVPLVSGDPALDAYPVTRLW
jgi:PIN domain nuclease of toxin-antitoxin system